jgi:threonine/homoserine/homoserine lactone efflux protein
MSSLVAASMSLTGKGFTLLILWGLSFFWFSLLAWVLSAQRFQAKLKQAALYIDALCGLVFNGIGQYFVSGGIRLSDVTNLVHCLQNNRNNVDRVPLF